MAIKNKALDSKPLCQILQNILQSATSLVNI